MTEYRQKLISDMNKGWDEFTAYLQTLPLEALTISTDAAGWTAKDHVMHLAVWEDGMLALLNRQPRYEQMGVSLELWLEDDYDAMNAQIQQRYRYLPFVAVMRRFEDIHRRMMQKVESLSEEELNQPYDYFMPEGVVTGQTYPIRDYISGNTFDHYAEHRPWIEAIINTWNTRDKSDTQQVFARIDKVWDYLSGYLATLSEVELSEPTDAAGWTAKDHVIHLAVWQEGVIALFNKQPRAAGMGVDEELFVSGLKGGGWDALNAVIQQQNRDLTWAQVKHRLEDDYKRFREKAASMSQADWQKPYGQYLPLGQENNEGNPIYFRLEANTCLHYPEHIEWIEAIVHPE